MTTSTARSSVQQIWQPDGDAACVSRRRQLAAYRYHAVFTDSRFELVQTNLSTAASTGPHIASCGRNLRWFNRCR
jgi:hypothetical protein